MKKTLEVLAVESELTDLIATYSLVDRKQWDKFRSIFTDTVRIDFSSMMGGASGLVSVNVDDLIAVFKGAVALFQSTKHDTLDILLNVEPKSTEATGYAAATVYLNFVVADADPCQAAYTRVDEFKGQGYYNYRFVYEGGRWKIETITFTLTFAGGNMAGWDLLFAGAQQASLAKTLGFAVPSYEKKKALQPA